MKKLAFVFAGQGAQKPGMALDFIERFDSAREICALASDAMGRDAQGALSALSQEEMNKTENAQPLTLLADRIAYRAAVDSGLAPAFLAGFSLGEYAALTASGAISEEEVFPLVMRRARYMSEARGGAMAAVIGASREDLASAIAQVEGYVIPANFNAPGQIVVSGDAEAVQALGVILKQQKKRLIPLRVSGAFHSAHMDEAAAKLRVDLDRVNWQKPALPLFMNIDAKNHAEDFAAIMEKQCKSPVYWEDTLYALRDAGAEVFVECGPGGVLTGLIKKTLPGLPAYCVEDMAGLGVALEALKEE